MATLAEVVAQAVERGGMAPLPQPGFQPRPFGLREIMSGLNESIAQPIRDDFTQGNRAIKNLRDRYPTVDNAAGLVPQVAAAQVANDVMASSMDGVTLINAVQAVPLFRMLNGGVYLGKQAMHNILGNRYVYDASKTLKKNVGLTAMQALGQPANAD